MSLSDSYSISEPSEALDFLLKVTVLFSARNQLHLNFRQVARAHHVQAESYLVYNVMSSGEVECSNSLEDAMDQALPSQAFVYRPVRQRVYSLLLGDSEGESWSRSDCARGPEF